MKIITYSRVSTTEQHSNIQRDEMRRYCKARNWEIIEELVDHGFSGSLDESKRPALSKALGMLRRREVDGLVVTKLDRLARSLRHLVNLMTEFQEDNINFVSIGDSLDMNSSSGRALAGVISVFAAFERDLLVERTLAGLEHARKRGVRLGRPPIATDEMREKIKALRKDGWTYARIQVDLGVSSSVVRKCIAE